MDARRALARLGLARARSDALGRQHGARALGGRLWVGGRGKGRFQEGGNGERVSPVMPYTWVMHVPGLSALREADRFALLGLVGAVLLAGSAVDWILLRRRYVRHAIPAAAVLAALTALTALTALEASRSGSRHVG